MTDITKAQFANFPNTAGLQTFNYAELLAQLQQDISGIGNVGLGVLIESALIFQVIPDTIETILNFDLAAGVTIHYDDLGFYDPVAAPTKLIIPAGEGITAVTVFQRVNFQANSTGLRALRGRKNNAIAAAGMVDQIVAAIVGGGTGLSISGTSAAVKVADGDFFESDVIQTSGVPLTLGNAYFGLLVVRQ